MSTIKRHRKIIIISVAILFLAVVAVCLKLFIFKPKEELKTSLNFIKNLSEERRADFEARKAKELEVIREYPNYYEAFLDLGNIEQELSNYRQALKYYDKASSIIPSSSIPILNKASLYIETDNLDKAYQEFWNAQKASPDYYLVYQKIIDFYQLYQKDKIYEIDEVYRMGIDNTNNDPDLLRSYGNYLMKNNRIADSQSVWEMLLSLYPNDQYAQQKLDEVNKAMGL